MLAARDAHPRGAAGMIERRFGRIVNITSAMVTTPRGHLGVSAGRARGLTAVCKGIARDVASDNVTINNLLPERIDTDRQRFMAERDMERNGISMEEARQRIAQTIAAGRMGRPEEFGATCAFVCSAHAGLHERHERPPRWRLLSRAHLIPRPAARR